VGRRTPVAHFWLKRARKFPLTAFTERSLILGSPVNPSQKEKPIHQRHRILCGSAGGMLRRGSTPLSSRPHQEPV